MIVQLSHLIVTLGGAKNKHTGNHVRVVMLPGVCPEWCVVMSLLQAICIYYSILWQYVEKEAYTSSTTTVRG
jgi:hypothetical protein